MPLPWKKAKCTRISQFVADHLQSPKRGGSLVVETGFPTSLIDLFVKNRDRLKKPSSNSNSKKKRLEAVIPDPISIPSHSPNPFLDTPSSFTTLATTTPSSSRPPNLPLVLPSPLSGSATQQMCSAGIGRGEVIVVDANGVFVAILKMFFVVVLALGTKRFVVGITMSAFLLLFMEYAGKHFCRLVKLKPCADAQKSLQCLIQRVLCFVGIIKRHKLMMEEEDDRGFKMPIAQQETTPFVVSGCSSLIDGHNWNDPIQEIQVVQTNSSLGSSRLIMGHKMNDLIQEIQIVQPSPNLVPPPPAQEIQNVKYEFDLRGGEEKWVSEELGIKEEVMEKEETYKSDVLNVKCRKSRGKIRSKIKQLVAKKLHNSKKKGLESKNETSSSSEEKEHEQDGNQCGLEYDDNSSSLSSGMNGDQVHIEDAICSSGELSLADIKDSTVREHFRRERERNSGYLIVFVIVLVGLVGGRVMALALTLSWYLLLKSTGTLQRCMKCAPDGVSISS